MNADASEPDAAEPDAGFLGEPICLTPPEVPDTGASARVFFENFFGELRIAVESDSEICELVIATEDLPVSEVRTTRSGDERVNYFNGFRIVARPFECFEAGRAHHLVILALDCETCLPANLDEPFRYGLDGDTCRSKDPVACREVNSEELCEPVCLTELSLFSETGEPIPTDVTGCLQL